MKCLVQVCEKDAKKAGFCWKHDRKIKVYGDPTAGRSYRTGAQPPGQRVKDLLKYARQIISLYG